jgi:FkbM family methyltransferase
MGSAVCFEPARVNYDLLRLNVVANGLDDRIRTERLALSNTVGETEFEDVPTNPGDGRVRVSDAAASADALLGEAERPLVKVPVSTIDNLLAEGRLDLAEAGIVWMDAQGHEGHILEGASRLLASDVPVVIEYWPYGLGRAGGMDRLNAAITANYSRVVDLRSQTPDGQPLTHAASDVASLAASYPGTDFTDLLLLK